MNVGRGQWMGPRPGAPRWGRRAGGGLGPRAAVGTCPYVGYGQADDESDVMTRTELYEQRMSEATRAAEEAARQAEIQSALAQQAQDFNRSIIVGFVGAGAVSVLMWALTQAITGMSRS